MDWQRRARAGEPLRVSATAYNAFVEAAIASRRGVFSGDAGGRVDSPTRLLARNTGANPIDRWAGCLIDGVSDSTDFRDGRVVLKVKPDEASLAGNDGRHVIAVERIEPNGIGVVVVDGVTICLIGGTTQELTDAGSRGRFDGGVLLPQRSGPIRVLGVMQAETSSTAGFAAVKFDSAGSSVFILAKITGHTAISGQVNRWRYDWEEVEVTDSGVVTIDGGLNSAQEGEALNLTELVNDGTQIEGPGWWVDEAPGTFTLRAIEEAVVRMEKVINSSGAPQWVFGLANVFDGTCEEGSGSG